MNEGAATNDEALAGHGVAAPTLYLFPALGHSTWWQALVGLERMEARGAPAAELAAAYARLLGELAAGGHADLASAAATTMVGAHGPLDAYAKDQVPAGLLFALEKDLTLVHHFVKRDHRVAVSGLVGDELPPLAGLAQPVPAGMNPETVAGAVAAVLALTPKERLQRFIDVLARFGSGPTALYPVLAWKNGELVGLAHPDEPSWAELFGLDEQLGRLERNIEALLAGVGAHHTLLYGPRGSGKSTAVRGLSERFKGRGLRLVEIAPGHLGSLPELVEQLRGQPTSFVVYVDDLAFDDGETAYRSLKSLLEGSLASRPKNVVVIATSNRRHIVKERMSDRPRPEDDVHGWDTHNEKLALADRFGLTITFPSTGQRSYLELVTALAALRGVPKFSDEQAIQFAEWGNGYSGRTAKQFVDDLTAGK